MFSCGFLSPLSPFLRRAGRGVLCLLVSFVAVLFLSSRFPHSLRSSPCLLVPRWIARVALVSVLVVAVVSVRVSSPLVASSPRSSTSVGGAGVGSLFACLPPFSDAVSSIVRAGGRRAVACLPLGWRTVSSAADCGRRGRWRGSLLASDGGGRCGVVGVLCSVCGVVVCIYKSGACSYIMDIVERKRTRKDFDDDERDGSG